MSLCQCFKVIDFYYHAGVVRPMNQETIATERYCYSQIPRESSMPHHTGPHRGEASGGRGRGKAQVGAFVVFL
jgi:hypothetical protein